METDRLALGRHPRTCQRRQGGRGQPFEFDKHPTEMINGIIGLIYSPSRIRYPMVRLDWLKKRERAIPRSAATTALSA